MKKYIIISLCLLGIVSINAQTTFGLKLSEISNDGVNYVVKIEMQMDGDASETFKLGSSSLQFNFPNETLSNPVLASTTVNSPTVYFEPTVTAPLTNLCSFNIELNVPNLPQNMEISEAPGWTELGQVSFTIININEIEPLSWNYNGNTTNTVVFLDDEATQIYLSENDEQNLIFEEGNVTSIDNNSIENIVSISPNPMTSLTEIKIDYSTLKKQELSYKLVNNLGAVIIQNEINSKEKTISIHRNDLSKGIYHFILMSKETVVQSSKIVII